jgi:hypothetical protein
MPTARTKKNTVNESRIHHGTELTTQVRNSVIIADLPSAAVVDPSEHR